MAKALRTLKIINFVFMGFHLFMEIKLMLSKITLTLPIFFRLLVMLFALVFMYSAVSVEVFQVNHPYNHEYSRVDCYVEGLFE
jgi:hypothetical protein